MLDALPCPCGQGNVVRANDPGRTKTKGPSDSPGSVMPARSLPSNRRSCARASTEGGFAETPSPEAVVPARSLSAPVPVRRSGKALPCHRAGPNERFLRSSSRWRIAPAGRLSRPWSQDRYYPVKDSVRYTAKKSIDFCGLCKDIECLIILRVLRRSPLCLIPTIRK